MLPEDVRRTFQESPAGVVAHETAGCSANRDVLASALEDLAGRANVSARQFVVGVRDAQQGSVAPIAKK